MIVVVGALDFVVQRLLRLQNNYIVRQRWMDYNLVVVAAAVDLVSLKILRTMMTL